MSRGANRRIIHVPRRFVAEEWGGTETVILETSRQQQRAGWEPEIYTSMALARHPREIVGGVPVRRFGYRYPFFGLNDAERRAMDKKGGNLLSLTLFAAMTAASNVRLFHAHALKRLGGEVRTAARLRRKPFVVSLHGGVFDVPEAELAAMTEPQRGKWEWGKVFGAVFGSRRVLEDADQVVCVGQSELDMARKQLGHDRIVYLPNGVDTAKFGNGDGQAFRAANGIAADAFLVLNIGRIDEQKNQLLLLQAFDRLRVHVPGARLVLIGPETRPAYAERLRLFVDEQNLHDSVTISPGLRNDDPALVDAMHACDVFALPSMHEPFGIVVLEAWSAGKPVVASAVGGLKALVAHEDTGLLFDPNVREAADLLCAALLRLERDKDHSARMGDAGRRNAIGHYDWAVISKRLETVYEAAEEQAARRLGRVAA